jgi:hypothetical protein
MSTQVFAATGLAIITLFMVIALATVGVHPSAPTSQVAERSAAQSVG